MPADSTTTLILNPQTVEWFKLIGIIISAMGVITGMLVVFFTKFVPWRHGQRNKRSLEKRIGAEFYPSAVLQNATRHYIEPDCQSLDPAGGDEPKLVYGARENIFRAVDSYLYNPTQYRYLIILADSGMGKTSFLLNYYVKNLKRRRKKLDIVLFPLGIPDIDKEIKNINEPRDKIIFLDALDEDTLAIVDHRERLGDLIEMTRGFKKVVITCRTQFFPKDEEIPRDTGVIRMGPLAAGQKAEHVFHKMYVSPFSNDQVRDYLNRHYPLWKRNTRKRAFEIVDKMPSLSIRPMLLAHIDDLLFSEQDFKYSFQIYEEMIDAWLIRDVGKIPGIEKEPLRQFSEILSLDLFLNRQQRGSERIPREMIGALAKKFGFDI